MGTPNDLLSDASKILQSEPVKNLLGPPTKEIGELLGTAANLVRFYATGNLEKIFTKWAQSRNGDAPSAADFRKIMPLLPLASMVSDEELQERWAALMESMATSAGALPSFGTTLSQLTAESVRYLNRLWEEVENRVYKQPFSYYELIALFDPTIRQGMSETEYQVFYARLSNEQKSNYERLAHARLVVQDLIRIGIIAERLVQEPGRYLLDEDQVIPDDREPAKFRAQYSFSQYGSSFMKAVTGKHEK
jgi:hypothetical protein